MNEIPLASEYVSAVLKGAKTSTVRRGRRDYALGAAAFKAGEQVVPIVVETVRYRRLCDLTEDDARRDGFNSLSELLSALHHHYSPLSATEVFTIVDFRRGG